MPTLNEIGLYLGKLSHGNESVTDGQTEGQTYRQTNPKQCPPFWRKRGQKNKKKGDSLIFLVAKKYDCEKINFL